MEDIFEAFYNAKDEKSALQMSAYMKNNFPFLGLSKPKRAVLSREFLKSRKKDTAIDWDFVFTCYSKPEREFHYLAIDYLLTVKQLLIPSDIEKIKQLILTNSWWDSVDSIDSLVAYMVLNYIELKETMLDFAKSENIWLKRTAIDFQLQYKDKTDTDLLEKIICLNLGSKEFFVNKAIGWILREYSKTNKQWVKGFIDSHELSPLSVREGSKYL